MYHQSHDLKNKFYVMLNVTVTIRHKSAMKLVSFIGRQK